VKLEKREIDFRNRARRTVLGKSEGRKSIEAVLRPTSSEKSKIA
jgi:hypothetical protein